MQGRSQNLAGGGARIFFRVWKFAYREATCALLGEFGGMLPREKNFKMVHFWCIFGSYFAFTKCLKLQFFI